MELLDLTTEGEDHREGIANDRMTGEWDIYLEKRERIQYLVGYACHVGESQKPTFRAIISQQEVVFFPAQNPIIGPVDTIKRVPFLLR